MPDRSSYAAEAKGVFKQFGANVVLHDVSIAVPAGESRALVGRNGAGKSTLVGVMTGLHSADAGDLWLAGAPAPAVGDRKAWRDRVACVYQRWMVLPHLTVAENLFLNNQPLNALRLVDWRRLKDAAVAALNEWDLRISPDLEAWRLTVEQRQIVEIARALLQGSRFIILDEPTAELERKEITRLFDRIRALQESGVTFLYISHHLEEIYEICKTVTVMRDGRVVADASLDDLPKDKLVGAMVGEAAMSARSADHRDRSAAPENARGLEISGLTVTGHVDAINLNIRPGECVGLAGLAGSGKDHVAEVVAGLLIPTSGELSIDGVRAPTGNVEAMRAAGVGFVPRDRHHRAIFPLLSVAENLTITVLDRFGTLGLVSPSRRTSAADQKIREVGIVTESSEQPIGQLSGGNQQKTVVARALTSEPKVLVLVAPTQGVDVASKEALFQIIGSAAAEKMAVLIVSDDLDELATCDRLEIIFRGKITKSFARGWREHDVVAAMEGLW
jgi:simple sugar transport system ATP-binding protein